MKPSHVKYTAAVARQRRHREALAKRSEFRLIDCTKLEAPMTDHTPTLKNLIETRRSQMNREVIRQRLISELKEHGC